MSIPTLKMNIPTQRMNLNLATSTFYALEDIKSRKCPNNTNILYKRRVSEFQKEVSYFQEFIAKKMARTMFDYLALAAIGEARHAQHFSNSEIIIDPIPNERNEAYKLGTNFNPTNFLDELYDLFTNNQWEGGYGGNSWARICKRALKYSKISSICFVDSCIHICHNNGIVYSKGILIDPPNEEFIEFLDYKAEQSFLDYPFCHSFPIYTDCRDFINKAYKLKLITNKGNLYIDANLYFPFINWGNQDIVWVEKKYENEVEDEVEDEGDIDEQETQEEEKEMVRLSRPWR